MTDTPDRLTALHDASIVIDGLVISDWSRPTLEAMVAGGITAANCTCAVWEGFDETLANIRAWHARIAANDDLLMPVTNAVHIHEAKAAGKVGIILGFQNTAPVGNDLANVQRFHDLGVRVMQLTYNNRNLSGCGCMVGDDTGLTDFGRSLIKAMNEAGVLIDLSHVGARTAADALTHSARPPAYTHCCPAALLDHPRNKSDDQLRAMADAGGFIGVATYPPFLPTGEDTTLDDGVAAMEHVIDVAGEAAVGIGTDFTQGQDAAFFDWLCREGGTGERMFERKWPVSPMPRDMASLADYPNLTRAMLRRGWKESRIRAVLGENWVRFLAEAW